MRDDVVERLFDPRVAGSLIGHLAGAINGSAVARKTSFLKDKRGAEIFASGIRVIDDPLRVRGLRSRPFDAEGVSGSRLAIVDDGVLKSWLLDSATARELSKPFQPGCCHRLASSSVCSSRLWRPRCGATSIARIPRSTTRRVR